MIPSAERPRLAVGVVGAGRVGSVLGAALAGAGHRIVAASAVSDASRRRAARLLPDVPLRPPEEVVRRCDLALLAVPDDALAGVAAGLASAVHPGQLVAHTSGRYGVAVLDPVADRGALPLALHPVMTFTGSVTDLARLPGCSFGITAAEPLRPVAAALVLEMGGEPAEVDEASRPLYHAALAYGANNLVTLVNTTADLLRRSGIDEPGRLLGPLLGAALDNALRAGDAALTGPVSRGDAQTVAAHLAALAVAAPDVVPAYVALARATADRALATGRLDPARAEALLDVLAAPYGART